MLEDFFEENEVDEIWIIHPDPRPKKSDTRRRLTSPRYMEIYKRIIKQGGWIHLKTDSTSLYEYSLEVLMDRLDIHGLLHTDNLDQSTYLSDHYGIKTRYELMFRVEGENIKYLKFQFQ
jgi:tRNA (guanine-N7-)-methyltransferase